jgi:DNA-binding beta-propeller fold protein YncE
MTTAAHLRSSAPALLVGFALSAIGSLAAAATPPTEPPPSAAVVLTAEPVAVPGGEGAIGFDDLGFAPALGKVLVPAGRTGNLLLFEPVRRAGEIVPGFSAGSAGEGHGASVTSADFGRGLLFAIDRTARRLNVIDPTGRRIVASAPLAGSPDYVRWVEPTGEIWVTEPDAERIEVFALPAGAAPTPVRQAAIAVPGGPESLVIHAARGRAYTNLWQDRTVAVDLTSRTLAASWPNGCEGSRGLALDAARGFLFVGCAEGRASVLDVVHDGAVLDGAGSGAGVDIIAYDPAHGHLYVPGARSATLTVFTVSPAGKLAVAATAATAQRAHCVTVDDHRQAWICDPEHGRLLVVADTVP